MSTVGLNLGKLDNSFRTYDAQFKQEMEIDAFSALLDWVESIKNKTSLPDEIRGHANTIYLWFRNARCYEIPRIYYTDVQTIVLHKNLYAWNACVESDDALKMLVVCIQAFLKAQKSSEGDYELMGAYPDDVYEAMESLKRILVEQRNAEMMPWNNKDDQQSA